MKMNFKELLENRKIERVGKEEFNLTLAEKDVASAKNNLNLEDYDWALSIAYNAVLRAGRNFMFSLGFRPIGKEHHKNVFEFLRAVEFNEELVDYFDDIRKKRNQFIYGVIEGTSEGNAKEVIKKAEDFLEKIKLFVENMSKNLEDKKESKKR